MLNLIIKLSICVCLLALPTAFTIVKICKWLRRKRNCTKEMKVKVTQVLAKKTRRSGYLYKPVFESMDPADQMVIDSAFYSKLVMFNEGDEMDLLVNPDNVKEFLYKDDELNKGRIADIIGCLAMYAGAIGLSVAFMLN